MAIRPVVFWPDPILSTRAQPVTDFQSADLKALITDMLDTCAQAQGLGLAAPQIGRSLAVIVVDDSEEQDGRGMKVFMNPTFMIPLDAPAQMQVGTEGCLSVPGEAHDVERLQRIIVRAQTETGEEVSFAAEGRRAAAYQHEIDHLEGRVYVEYLGSVRRDIIRRKMTKVKRDIERQKAEIAERLAFATAHAKLTEAKAKALVEDTSVTLPTSAMQGVDCVECEENTPHKHITS